MLIKLRGIFAIAGGNEALIKTVIKKYGYTGTKDIALKDYNQICTEIEKGRGNVMEMVTEMVVTRRIDAQIDFNYDEAEQYLNGLLTNFHEWQIQEADLPLLRIHWQGLTS